MRVVLLAALLLLVGCGGEEPQAAVAAPTTAPAATLPDGRTPTPQQQAFLSEVLPQLSAEKAADVLTVLGEGESACTIFTNLDDPAQQQQAVNLFLDTDRGWTQTEAWVMVRGASTHFC